jgi:hypothetical protein
VPPGGSPGHPATRPGVLAWSEQARAALAEQQPGQECEPSHYERREQVGDRVRTQAHDGTLMAS